MLRIIGSRVMLPKGDTGSFRMPIKQELIDESTVVVFSVFDKLTRKTILEKQFGVEEDGFCYISINHDDTKDLQVGKYFWDLKIYYMPVYDEDGILIDAMQIDSIYSTHHMATFLITEVGKHE